MVHCVMKRIRRRSLLSATAPAMSVIAVIDFDGICSAPAARDVASYVASLLDEQEEFGPTPANAMMWLNRAKAEGRNKVRF